MTQAPVSAQSDGHGMASPGVNGLGVGTLDSAGQVGIRPAYWAHWVLKSARQKRMVEWYRCVLGAEVVHDAGRIVFLTWDGEHHRLAVLRMPGLFRPLSWLHRAYRKFYGLDHMSFNFPGLRPLLEHFRKLRQAGIRPVWAINHGPTTSIYYEDPDGNRLEFQCDNFETLDEVAAFVAGPVFQKNFIGVNVDPNYLLERLDQGVPEAVLKRQGEGTPPGRKPVAGMKAINWKTL